MKLAAHSVASYVSEPKARRRAGCHFFLSNNAEIPTNNDAILNIAHIIKHAELVALYIMAWESLYIRIILEEIGHTRPPTPLQIDNSMADGVVNGKITQKRTKAMDMRFHWLRDQECQEQFRMYWRPGKLNYDDWECTTRISHTIYSIRNVKTRKFTDGCSDIINKKAMTSSCKGVMI